MLTHVFEGGYGCAARQQEIKLGPIEVRGDAEAGWALILKTFIIPLVLVHSVLSGQDKLY